MKAFKDRLVSLLILAAASLSWLSAEGAAQRRFYIAPDDHTDYFWSGDDVAYRAAFLRMTDYYLGKMDSTQGNTPDHQMRWSCDGSLWMWEYERNRTPQQFDRFISRLRDGRLSVPLNPLVLVQGGSPAEAVLRGMYYPGLIERRHNVRFPLAIAMENQTLPLGLPSLWAGSGAKYSWKGVCNCATDVPGLNDRDREIYYAQGRDGSRVLMKWNSLYTNNQMFGGYSEAFDPIQSILFAEGNPTFNAKYPYPVVGIFGAGWDALEYLSDEFVTVAQQNSNANRRVIVSNTEDFFRDFEQNYGTALQSYSAAFGNDWDILVASMPEVSSKIKRATEKLRSAEAMATLVALDDPKFMAGREPERDQAMMNLGLYFEHDWTADGPVSRTVRANWSRSVQRQVSAYVDDLYNDARLELGKRISRSGSEQRFFVFNPLSWQRTEFADLPLPAHMRKARAVDLATGLEVPSQIVRNGPAYVLRIIVPNIPSLGYKTFEIRGGNDTVTPDAATVTGSTMENEFYRLTLSPDGSITSLIDKTRSNREVVRVVDGLTLNDLGGNNTGTVRVESAGPVSVTLLAISSSPVPHTTRVTLYRNSRRIDISNEITQTFSGVRSWNYSFNLNSPDLWHEEVGAVIRAKLLANGGHYSPRNARYDWLTMNHFADMSDGAGNFGVTVSNWDNYFMRLGDSSVSTLDTSSSRIAILAGGQTEGPNLGIPNQGGDSHFLQRFALTTHGAYSQTDAMKFSLEHQNPLVAGMIAGTGTHDRAYPEVAFSFLNISSPDVLLWALKPAEDGIENGIVTRFWNQRNSAQAPNVTLNRPITSATRTTHIETPIAPAAIAGGVMPISIDQQKIQTYVLRLD